MTIEEETNAGFEKAQYVRSCHSYDCPTSIHHVQLRDLVSAADNEHQFYCVQGQQVLLYDTKTSESTVIMSLSFQPNAMTYRHGYLAAGGLRSELEVRHLPSGRTCFKGYVGGTVNNALHVGRHSNGEMRLFVCNNDDTVKVFDLPSMAPLSALQCAVPANYAALTPDGAHLAVVGDCSHTLLYEATPSGYALVSTFNEAKDVGMSAAWSPYGNLLASAHQDGTTAVWDLRSGSLVARHMCDAAARCIKFSAGPVDLLAVSEHEERVRLLDARRWDAACTLEATAATGRGGGGGGGGRGVRPGSGGRLGGGGGGRVRPPGLAGLGGVLGRTFGAGGSDGEEDHNISGICFTPLGKRLWVGLEECVLGYDIDGHERTTFGVKSLRGA